MFHRGVKAGKRFSQGDVQGVYRAVAFACGDFYLVVNLDLYLGRRIDAFFGTRVHAVCLVVAQFKEGLVFSHDFSDQKLKASVGALKLVAFKFKLLHPCHNRLYDRVVLCNAGHELLNLLYHHGAAGDFAHKEDARVSNAFRLHVLVGRWVFEDRVDVHSCLVGKGVCADIGHAGIKRKVCELRHALANGSERLYVFAGKAFIAHL